MDPSDWATDRELTNGVVRQLVDEQFPILRGAALGRLGEGWDAKTWLANDEWVLRFPKRRGLVRQLARETEVLRLIAGRLPLPVPRFELFGRLADLPQYVESGLRMIEHALRA
jgi:aminoglycoside phosphotransferase (APT) family kinase protein